MTELVIDASVAIKWVLAEVHSDYAHRLLGEEFEILAPSFLLLECANILWKQVRFAALPETEAGISYRALVAMRLELHDTKAFVARGLEIALETGRTVYDSVYLALAEQEEAQLVTADQRFYNALAQTAFSSTVMWIEDVSA